MNCVQELSFDELRAALKIGSDEDLEAFLIEAIVNGCIRAKIDGAKRRVHCSGVGQIRDFTPEHWQQLLTTLRQWETTLKTVCFAFAPTSPDRDALTCV